MVILWISLMMSSFLIAATGHYCIAQKVLVMDCKANENHNRGAGAWRSDKEFRPLHPFTVCSRFSFQKLRLHNLFAYFAQNEKRPPMELQLNMGDVRIVWAWEYKRIIFNESLRPYRWYILCVTYNSHTKTLSSYVNGELLQEDLITLQPDSVGTNLTLGYREPWVYRDVAFIGNLTQFNMWSRILTLQEISDQVTCKRNLRGDFIGWEDREWNFSDVQLYHVDLSELCQKDSLTTNAVMAPLVFSDAEYMCEAAGGEMYVPFSMHSALEAYNKSRDSMVSCTSFWVGASDQIHEGAWINSNGKEFTFPLPWGIDEPNGVEYENCATLRLNGLEDADCATKRCSICTFNESLTWTLHGSCEELSHNMMFFFSPWDENTYVHNLHGYQDYLIYNDTSTGMWTWINQKEDATIARLGSSRFPFGRQIWELAQPLCNSDDLSKIILITVCKSHQFTCDDGTCIPIENRCNLYYDCIDNSDEKNCTIYKLSEDYEKSIPPRDISSRSLHVGSSINLEAIRVDTNDMVLHVIFNLTLTWKDGRATFLNLKQDTMINVIDTVNNEVWTPRIVFRNTKLQRQTIVDKSTRMNVVRLKASHLLDRSYPEEVTLYPGSLNPIVSHRKYQTSFTCDFDLKNYPFDTQTCFIDLRLQSGTSESLEFSPFSNASYTGPSQLLEYQVGDISLATYVKDGYSGLKVKIPLKRLQGYVFINVYIPSSTMLIIGYLTLYYKKDIFEVRIMAALTSLLVIVTLFTEVASSLPRTSYFKLVDIWLLFCISTTFFVLAFHIVIDLNLTKTLQPKEKRYLYLLPRNIEGLGKASIATGIALFNVVYWLYIYV